MRAIPCTRPWPVVAAFALLLACLGGCGPKDKGATPGGGGADSNDVVPCFADAGPVALLVNGVPVPEATLTRFAAFFRDGDPAFSAEFAKQVALERAIIPTAVCYAAARTKKAADESTPLLVSITAAVKAAKARLDAKEDFAAVARATSGWPTVEKDGGALDEFTRLGQIVAPISASAFAIEKGDCPNPIVTPFGVHLVRVISATDGASKAEDKRKIVHILIPFDAPALKDMNAFGQHVRALAGTAKVEIKIESWRQSVPMAYR